MARPPVTAASVRPAERGGPIASSRLDFQKNWTLCHLLELHENGKDYVLVCDYHDDVLVLEPRDQGDGILHFYQVKSAKKQWTLAALLRRAAGETPANSILGKLYKHTLAFGDSVGSVNLVSNERFDLKLNDGASGANREDFRFEEVGDTDRTIAEQRIATEHALDAPAVFPKHTHFLTTNLTPGGQDTYVRGRLTEFFDVCLQKKGVDVMAAYRALFDEIRLKSNNESLWPDMTGLIAKKGIHRDRLDGMLRRLSVTADYPRWWANYFAELGAQQVSIVQRNRIEGFWIRYRAARMDETAEAVQKFRERVCVATGAEMLASPDARLVELLDRVVARVGADNLFVGDHIRAASLLELTDNEHPAIQKAHSQQAPEDT